MVIRSVHRLSRMLLTYPAQVRHLGCSITSVTFVFSITQMFVFLSQYLICLTYFIPSSFVRLVACSLLGWFVSSSMFHCHLWTCRAVWRMLSIRLWFFFESLCLGFCAEFALSRKLSRSRRIRCRVGCYILCTSPWVGLCRGCGQSLRIWFSIQLSLVAGFRRVSSLAFSFVLPEYFIDVC